jgi:hypothetical protein
MCLVELQHEWVIVLEVAGGDPTAFLGTVAGPVN